LRLFTLPSGNSYPPLSLKVTA